MTSAEVADRTRRGLVNELPPSSGRTVGQIIRANVFTRINTILAVLFGIVLFTGSIINGAFGLLIVANSIVGVVQELRAKRTLDRLSIVGRARPRVIRDGGPAREIDREEVVLGELVEAGAGDQVVVDGVVRSARGLEVDESMLTGESDPVAKSEGDEVFSGSAVVAGQGAYQATKVGREAYAAQLAAQASKFTLTRSELFGGINRILRVITWLLVPTGLLTIWTQLFRTGERDIREALLAMVASLVPMVPEGLVLMTSIAFALGVIRLGRRRVLVNELPAIEGLARVSVVCADKTGTLTENRMVLGEVIAPGPAAGGSSVSRDDAPIPAAPSAPAGGADEPEGRAPEIDAAADPAALRALAAMIALDVRPNATAVAIAEGLAAAGVEPDARAEVAADVPFTSARKWQAATFRGGSTWVLGAPDILAAPDHPAAELAEDRQSRGLRVLLLCRSDSAAGELDASGLGPESPAEEHPGLVEPAAVLVLEQKIRDDARDTLDYFEAEDVHVKVISGDNAGAVGAVARTLDLPGAESPVDARDLPDPEAGERQREEFDRAVAENTVFGRVTPERKRQMVRALRDRGEVVAMTGDGVNDVLALKDADIGVAMGTGAPATRSVGQLVLLDDRFAAMPPVVAEGRRVIGNIERVANLFLTKTIYSVVLALAVGIIGHQYPFEPIHVTVTGWFTIGIPAFVLSLAPNHERARPGFASRVLRMAVPAGVIVGALTFAFWFLHYPKGERAVASAEVTSTATLVVLIVSAFWVLVCIARPYRWWKVLLLATSATAYVLIFTVPPLAELLRLDIGGAAERPLFLSALAWGAAGAALVEIVHHLRRKSQLNADNR
ncbi:HAD-IC family P-type ATPase [Corynebacterium sp. 335C]